MYYYLLGPSRFRAKMADAMKVVVWYFAKSLSSLNPIDVHKNYQQPRDKRTRKVSVLKLADILHFLSLHSAGHKQCLRLSNGLKVSWFSIFFIFGKLFLQKKCYSEKMNWVGCNSKVVNSKILITILIYVAFFYIFYKTIWQLP